MTLPRCAALWLTCSLLCVVDLGAQDLAAQDLAAQELADLPLLRSDRYVSFSSRDPGGSNEDWGHYLQVDERGVRRLAQFDGPGRVVRVWSADPQGEVVETRDGVRGFAGPFRGLFDGRTPPFLPPLARTFAGGSISHVAIPFAKSWQLDQLGGPAIYYQIAALLGEGPAKVPLPEPAAPVQAHVEVRGEQQLMQFDGPGELVELRVRLSQGDARRLWIVVVADGAAVPTLQAPLDLLLPNDLPTAATSVDGDGWRQLSLPMPVHRSLRLSARYDGDGAAVLDFAATPRKLPQDHARGYLHASFVRAQNVWGQPFPVLALDGRHGHLVGVTAELCGAPAQGLSFLEGDETVLADGAPALLGTGTEDFFDGAWYFRGNPQGSPSAAVAQIDDRLCRVRTSRWFLFDPVPFQQSLSFTLEHGGGNDAAGSDYATLALWYDDHADGVAAPALPNALPANAPPPPPQWQDLPAAQVFRDATVRDGVVLLGRGAHALPQAATGYGYTLRRAGRAVSPTVLVAAGQAGSVRLDRDAEVDAVRRELLQPAVRELRVLGPFASGGDRRGLDRKFGPETERAEDAAFDGLGDGPRTWREVHVDAASGVLDLDALTGHRDEVVAFVATWVSSPKDQDVVLWLGSDDAVRVWLDDKVVHEHRGVRGCVRDQDRVPLRLTAGEHELRLEVEDYAGGFGCFLRLEGEGLSCRPFKKR